MGNKGSTIPFSEVPTISPRALTEPASLQFCSAGGSATKSVTMPFCHPNAWKTLGTRPSGPPQTPPLLVEVVGAGVAEPPTVVPWLFRAGTELNTELTKLMGPPNVHVSMSL